MSNKPTYTDIPIAVVPNDEVSELPIAHAILVHDSPNNQEDRLLLINTYQYGRTIKIFVTIDAFFILRAIITRINFIEAYGHFFVKCNYKKKYVNA